MAWINLLTMEANTGTRTVEKSTPQNAAKFSLRCPWDDASRIDPGRHLEVSTKRLTVGSFQTAVTPLKQAAFSSSGVPDLGPEDIPGTGAVPINLHDWKSNNRLEFSLLQTEDSGSPQMVAGLQVKWFDASNVELTADGNVDPNPEA